MARYDLVIRNATIVDGTRAPRFQADVAVQNGRIQEIGTVEKEYSGRVIEASGKILAPGFIDAHTHDDPRVHRRIEANHCRVLVHLSFTIGEMGGFLPGSDGHQGL